MASMVVSAALAAMGAWWSAWFGDMIIVANVVDAIVSFALISVMFAMIDKWMPLVKVARRDVWIGAALTALLFNIGKLLSGVYIGRSGVASAFGAAASLVVLLLWLYYSA